MSKPTRHHFWAKSTKKEDSSDLFWDWTLVFSSSTFLLFLFITVTSRSLSWYSFQVWVSTLQDQTLASQRTYPWISVSAYFFFQRRALFGFLWAYGQAVASPLPCGKYSWASSKRDPSRRSYTCCGSSARSWRGHRDIRAPSDAVTDNAVDPGYILEFLELAFAAL